MPRPKRPASTTADVVLPSAATEAFAKIEPKLASLPDERLVSLDGIDVPRAVSTVLAALPKLRTLRPALVDELPRFPVEVLDDLEQVALAAWYAHLVATAAPESKGDAKALLDEGATLREDLLVGAEALAYRSLLDKDRVAALRKQPKPDLANDLVTLVGLFRDAWEKVRGKTAVEERELERAAELAPRLLAAQSAPANGAKADAPDRRVRAFSMLVHSLESLRRPIAYLRWNEHDADSFVPSLLKSPRGRKPKARDSVTPAPPSASSYEENGVADDEEEEVPDL
ncbi:MAG TPA: hypothetical protein VFS43_18775 [Polyangiaceae bacterium]|nr:hypothetical protein [Polyangiaceae bacterium]